MPIPAHLEGIRITLIAMANALGGIATLETTLLNAGYSAATVARAVALIETATPVAGAGAAAVEGGFFAPILAGLSAAAATVAFYLSSPLVIAGGIFGGIAGIGAVHMYLNELERQLQEERKQFAREINAALSKQDKLNQETNDQKDIEKDLNDAVASLEQQKAGLPQLHQFNQTQLREAQNKKRELQSTEAALRNQISQNTPGNP